MVRLNYDDQTELSWSDWTIMIKLNYYDQSELSLSDWTIMIRVNYHDQTELSWSDWTIMVRLNYYDQSELSWSDWTIMVRLNYHGQTELSWSDWTIMVRLNYHGQTELTELSWSDWTIVEIWENNYWLHNFCSLLNCYLYRCFIMIDHPSRLQITPPPQKKQIIHPWISLTETFHSTVHVLLQRCFSFISFRRWFMIQNNQLVYCKRSKDSLTVMEDDLRLCTVKPISDIDRRHCFEIISPTRSHMLQADSQHDCNEWISSIQAGVSKAYRDTPHEEDVRVQLLLIMGGV